MKPLSIQCGVCKALPGQPCTAARGVPAWRTHAVRTSAAKRGNQPPHSVPSWLEGRV